MSVCIYVFEQAPGYGEEQGSLACCSPWGRKESDTTERLNNKYMCLKKKKTLAQVHTDSNPSLQGSFLSSPLFEASFCNRNLDCIIFMFTYFLILIHI